MAQDAALGSLVDELLTCIATFLPDAASLLAFERVSSRFASVAHEAAWRGLCEKRWEDKPRYRLTAKREAELSTHMRTLSWRRRYATFEVDGRRSSITDEELCSLGWYFNYTPDAGGLGRETLRRVVFKDGRLAVPDYPNLRYALVRLRENAESIAFYRGEAQEAEKVRARLGGAVENKRALLATQEAQP